MQEDEGLALKVREKHREVFRGSMEAHGGEIIQYYGDGTLSVFESCIDAVRSAKEMQEKYQSDPVIPVRIGIHLGDIILSNEEIIGNSVNIASRVESLGVPGSVLISEKVFDEIRNKEEFEVENLGAFHFKNDTNPRTIYALTGDRIVVPKKNDLQGKLEHQSAAPIRKRMAIGFLALAVILTLGWYASKTFLVSDEPIRSLAVLPLYDRIGLTADENYLIEGIHEEIISKLSKSGFDVKPYSTMIQYRDRMKTPEEIGSELKVDGLVEGSVFRTTDRYKIRVQIIDVDNEEYLSDPYEAEVMFSDIVNIYEGLVGTIARQIEHTLTEEVQDYLAQGATIDPEAYDLYLQGRYNLSKGSAADIRTAIDLFNGALSIDSTFGDAHVSLVSSYLHLGFSSENPEEELEKFRFHLNKARELNPLISKDHHLMAMARIFDNWDWKGAIREVELAIEQRPGSWETHDTYCQLMWAVGETEKSISAGRKAVSLDPNAHYAQCDLAWAYYADRQYDKAKVEVEKTIEKFSTDCPTHMGLSILADIALKQQIGQTLIPTIDRIKREVDTIENLPVYNESLLAYAYALEGDDEEARSALVKLEAREELGIDKVYAALGMHDKAFEQLDKAIQNRSFFQMYTIKMAPWYDPIRTDERFDRILERMGLKDWQLQ